jgi:hypothetical protein
MNDRVDKVFEEQEINLKLIQNEIKSRKKSE